MEYGAAARTIGIVIGIIIIAFLWETGRRTWYWAAAKIFGWSKQEKFERETAWLDRAVLREKRQAEKDERVRHNADRRRIGAWLVTVSIVWATSQSAMPWWEVVSIGAAVYVGMHLAAGVTFKWW
jgi:hypothetical protein